MRHALVALTASALLLPAGAVTVAQGQQQGGPRTSSRIPAAIPGISVQWNTPPPAPSTAPGPRGPGRGSQQVPHAGATDGRADQFLAGPYTYAPRYGRYSGRPGRGSDYLYGGYVPFGYSTYADPYERSRDARAERDAEGRLVLRVTPSSANVFVDGLYVGVVDDSRERGLWLEAGPHRIELRADGYDTEAVEIRIAEGETINYRRELARQAAAVDPPRRAAAPPKPFYVIRGCYAGDTAPDAARLPAGCRAADVRMIPPVVGVVNR